MIETLKKVTSIELQHALEATTPEQFRLLKMVFHATAEFMKFSTVVKLCVYDWSVASRICSYEAALGAIMAMEKDLDDYANCLETTEQINSLPLAIYSWLDYRFVFCEHAFKFTAAKEREFFDSKTGDKIKSLPQHALTSVTCDLNVLIARLDAKISKTRKLQEKINADTQAAEKHVQTVTGTAVQS